MLRGPYCKEDLSQQKYVRIDKTEFYESPLRHLLVLHDRRPIETLSLRS